ncbi:iron/manganese superoxide dismutase [Psychroflexus torquis ATCC 700755]|uniref:Superoxide dismutase n=1 Tax=Psychroflexus torquis (strain ATCC 700755 / CIP 106069 / ACAM 623) TaxID=313595 RepID=K4IHT7_PSYTT|nr:Fe-Mn family superoxide dismutase [Psychroflexus torquis]AFU68626.1 iron/manganese superoxide dismutase [Psychroflexus torquis ATCC 700755]
MNVSKKLPDLPYNKQALLSFVMEETFDYHFGKHQAVYVKNLNSLNQDAELEEKTVEELILERHKKQDTALFSNTSQHWSQSCLSPNGSGRLGRSIKELTKHYFQSFDKFKAQFLTLATKLFGAGWAWLAQNDAGKLKRIPMKDLYTTLTESKEPILTSVALEHDYYIDYRNARSKFVERFWNIVNHNIDNINLNN